MATTKLSQKYQIVVPREVREKLKLSVGQEVRLYAVDHDLAVIVRHPKDRVKALKGLGKELWRSLGGADSYIKQERAAWKRKSV